MKTWMLAAVSLFALGAVAPATAADLPIYKAPVTPVLTYDWTGVYGGINGGFGLAHACWGITGALGVAVDPPVGEGCHNASGGTVGGQIGYRWQKSRWVFGIEGQGNWADFKGSNPSVALAPLTNQTKIDAFGLFTGQMGYAVNSLLFYGKAGAAVAHDKYDTFVPGVPALAFNSVNQTRWGYGVGFGVEYGFAENWSVSGEYDHLFLGHHTADFATLAGGLLAPDRPGYRCRPDPRQLPLGWPGRRQILIPRRIQYRSWAGLAPAFVCSSRRCCQVPANKPLLPFAASAPTNR